MQKYTSIILASLDANEFDRIYTLYTLEQGLVRAVARGARKPAAKLAAHLEPMTLSEVYVARSRGMGQITGAIALESFEGAKKNFETLNEILGIFDFFKKFFSEEEKDERIFWLLREFLSTSAEVSTVDESLADKSADKAEILVEAFWWKLFDLLGQKPEVLKCVKCGQRLSAGKNNFFSLQLGGILCGTCKKAEAGIFPVNENQIKFLRLIFSNSLEVLQKLRINHSELAGLEIIRKSYSNYYFS